MDPLPQFSRIAPPRSRRPPSLRSFRPSTHSLSALATYLSFLLASSWVSSVSAQNANTAINLDEMETMFNFGDSWSTTGYVPETGRVRELEGIGKTSSGGYNWIQYLAYANPKLSTSYYDLARSEATTNNTIVSATVPCFIDQVNIWKKWFTGNDSEVKWNSNTTLFTVWFGINDVGFATVSNQNSSEQQPHIFITYWNVINTLYAAGARNILLMGVPPTHRTPFIQWTNELIISTLERYISEYNHRLYDFATALPRTYPKMNVALFDTGSFLNTILDHPEQYGFKHSKYFCEEYGANKNRPNDSLEICGAPLEQFVWYDTYHPTWAVHRLLASVLVEMLSPPEPQFDAPYTTLTILPEMLAADPSGTSSQSHSVASRGVEFDRGLLSFVVGATVLGMLAGSL